MEDIFGECISAYSRAQAIEDGILVDVTRTASEAGFKWPTAITRTVYERYIEVPAELTGQQDIQGTTVGHPPDVVGNSQNKQD